MTSPKKDIERLEFVRQACRSKVRLSCTMSAALARAWAFRRTRGRRPGGIPCSQGAARAAQARRTAGPIPQNRRAALRIARLVLCRGVGWLPGADESWPQEEEEEENDGQPSGEGGEDGSAIAASPGEQDVRGGDQA
jgi:hypothetical protein